MKNGLFLSAGSYQEDFGLSPGPAAGTAVGVAKVAKRLSEEASYYVD